MSQFVQTNMSSEFILHNDFAKKFHITNLELCTVLLEPIEEFPWIMLIPMVDDVKNILGLSHTERNKFWLEVEKMSEIMNKIYKPDQLNIAMLGNKTPQLHCHIIARFENDSAFPGATFGFKSTKASSDKLEKIKIEILKHLND